MYLGFRFPWTKQSIQSSMEFERVEKKEEEG